MTSATPTSTQPTTSATTTASTPEFHPVGRQLDGVGIALLDAAHRVLTTDGPFALTVRRVAQAAGVSTMNVYSRFGGKDGLVEQLFIEGFTRIGEHMMSSVPHTDDPIADMRICRGVYRQFALENPTYYAVMFDSVIPDWTPSPAAAAVAYEALGGLASNVQRAIDAGAMHATDAMSVATSLWSCSHGLITLEMRMGDRYGFDWATIYDETLERLLMGFCTGEVAGDYKLGRPAATTS